MREMSTKGIAAIALLAAATPAQAASDAAPLQPSSQWIVDYADNSCRLIRSFGEGPQTMRLELRLFEPGEHAWVVLSGKPLGTLPGGQTQVAYRFAPDDRDMKSEGLTGHMDNDTAAAIFPVSLLTADARKQAQSETRKDREARARWEADWQLDREAQIDTFEVAVSGKRRMVLHIGSLKAAMDVTRQCLDNLVGAWGLDLKVQRSLARAAVPTSDPSRWLNSNDYPTAMLEGGFNDIVDFRLMVDANGTPTSCDVLTMDSRPEFIKATCDPLMQRARFEPALDADGKPVASVYINTVRWFIAG